MKDISALVCKSISRRWRLEFLYIVFTCAMLQDSDLVVNLSVGLQIGGTVMSLKDVEQSLLITENRMEGGPQKPVGVWVSFGEEPHQLVLES